MKITPVHVDIMGERSAEGTARPGAASPMVSRLGAAEIRETVENVERQRAQRRW